MLIYIFSFLNTSRFESLVNIKKLFDAIHKQQQTDKKQSKVAFNKSGRILK